MVILSGAGMTLYTVPAGKTERIHLIAGVLAWGGAGRNLRFRVKGLKVIELNDTGTPTPPFYIDLGEFILNGGDTLTVSTSNSGTEGGTAIYTASILESVPS